MGVEVSDKSKYESVKQADLIINHELDHLDQSLNNHDELLTKLKSLDDSGRWNALSVRLIAMKFYSIVFF